MDILTAIASIIRFVIGLLFALSLNQIIIIVLALFFIKKLRRTKRYKGWIGEQKVRALLWLWLPKNQYHRFYDVTLPAGEGTTQIDHIIVSKYGVFVIECKNIRGWIFGQERDDKWTLQLHKKTIPIANPMRQNYGHVQALRSLLNYSEGTVRSIVAFPEAATFKTKLPANVLKYRDICTYIKSHDTPILLDSAVEECIDTIGAKRLKPGLLTNMRHRRHVRRLQDCSGSERKLEPPPTQAVRKPLSSPAAVSTRNAPDLHAAHNHQPCNQAAPHNVTATPHNESHRIEGALAGSQTQCPKCGREMVLRTAQSGGNAGKDFWGCSTFPKCYGTRSVGEMSSIRPESCSGSQSA